MINTFTQLTEIAEGNVNSNLMNNIIFITNQGANIVNSLRNNKRLNCYVCLINTALENFFDITFLSKKDENGLVPLTPITNLLTECKNLLNL